MAKKIKPMLEDILLEQGLNHILNSPDTEFVKFSEEFNMDMDDLAKVHGAAATAALQKHVLNKHVSPKAKSEPLHILGYDAALDTRSDKVSLLKKLMENAKQLGLSVTFHQRDLELIDDIALELQIAQFKSLIDGHSTD